MIAFPRIEGLIVQNYGLYPGASAASGLTIDLTSGPCLILGVNGLGKSTLLLLLRYVLTGPVRARTAGFAGEKSSDIQIIDPRLFAVRVIDGARNAVATIRLQIGSATVTVERRLFDLSLVRAVVDHGTETMEIVEEQIYREKFASLMQLAQFDDAIRVLDRVVFFLENRQPLMWDLASQFEIFRAVLTPQSSAELRRLEGLIVSADSAARNLNAILFKIVDRRSKEQVKAQSADDTRARLAAALADRDRFVGQEAQIQEEQQRVEEEQADLRLRVKRAEHEADTAAQAYERIKFDVLRAAFAGVKPNEQYVFLRLISERICLACNREAEAAAAEIEKRRSEGRCLVCGQPRERDENVAQLSEAMQERSEKAYEELDAARTALREAEIAFVAAGERLGRQLSELHAVREKIDEADQRARRLRKLLPFSESAQLAREDDRIATLRREVQTFREERDESEGAINRLLDELRAATEQIREALETRFQERASPFFAEKVRLVYAPRETRIGQGGRVFSFPAFEIEMTSGATQGEFVRRRADQVSLSQREYLDLIFRMALLDVFSTSGGTLAVDGPEGSLDAVFAERAGDLFARFASKPTNNVFLACNIVEGGFIPHTLRDYVTKTARQARVVNLIELATPTAALRNLKSDYLAKVRQILSQRPRP